MDGAAADSSDSSLHHDLPFTPPEAAEDHYYSDSGLFRVSLTEAPILLLIKFHRALRLEVADLRRVTLAAAESGGYGGEFVSGLIRRVEFLKLAYKYHCAAEDEVTADSDSDSFYETTSFLKQLNINMSNFFCFNFHLDFDRKNMKCI